MMLFFTMGSGTMLILPWAPGINECIGYVNFDKDATAVDRAFKFAIPLIVVMVVVSIVMMFIYSIVEKKRGAGMTDEEFQAMKAAIDEDTKIENFNKPVAIFDIIFTLAIVVLILLLMFAAFSACGKRGEQKPSVDISGIPQAMLFSISAPNDNSEINTGYMIDDTKYVYYLTAEFDQDGNELKSSLCPCKIIGYQLIEGSFYKYFATVDGLQEDLVIRFSDNYDPADPYNIDACDILMAEGTTDIPDWLVSLKEYKDRQEKSHFMLDEKWVFPGNDSE